MRFERPLTSIGLLNEDSTVLTTVIDQTNWLRNAYSSAVEQKAHSREEWKYDF